MPQLLTNLFHSIYSSFFHRETFDSSLDCAKMGVVCHKEGVVVDILHTIRAQLDIGPTQPSISSYAYDYCHSLAFFIWFPMHLQVTADTLIVSYIRRLGILLHNDIW